MAMCRDKAFVDEAEKLGIDMSPIDGDGDLEVAGADRGHAEGRDCPLQRDRRGEEIGGAPVTALTPSPKSGPAS